MWWSDDEWMKLADPAGCGMCADAGLEENEHSLLVAETEASWVRLSRNQAHPGYCVVILREHVTNMADLEEGQLGRFWRDVQHTGRLIEEVFSPRKIDYLVMGHQMPHLHCHLLPQHASDDPRRNVNIADGPITPTTDALYSAVDELRRAHQPEQSPTRRSAQADPVPCLVAGRQGT